MFSAFFVKYQRHSFTNIFVYCISKILFPFVLKSLIHFIFNYSCNAYIHHKHILFITFNYTIGKLFLLKSIANHALVLGLNVCVSAPTGKLASTYAIELPMCRCNTAHTNYFIPVGNTRQSNVINWGHCDVHVLLVDEVIRLSLIVALILVIDKLLERRDCFILKSAMNVVK